MVSLRAEREQATALLRRDRWRLGIVIGVVLLAIALRARHGLWGLLAERTGISLFPVRRRLKLPAPPTAGGSR